MPRGRKNQKEALEIFLDLTSATSEFIPIFEERLKQIGDREKFLKELERREQESIRFVEDYIIKMRSQVQRDMERLEQGDEDYYFPDNMSIGKDYSSQAPDRRKSIWNLQSSERASLKVQQKHPPSQKAIFVHNLEEEKSKL